MQGPVSALTPVGARNHRYFLLFVLSLIVGISSFVYLTVTCKFPFWPRSLDFNTASETASDPLALAGSHDPFLVAVACWATLQLTWTSILAVSQLWQVSRQVTTLEVSNLGRYGYMGGRGGSSLRDQTGAMRQATAVGAGVGQSGAEEDATDGAGPEGNVVRHVHRKPLAGCMQVLGLDRFTKGQALGGMKRAGRAQNPFDLGLVRVSTVLTWLM